MSRAIEVKLYKFSEISSSALNAVREATKKFNAVRDAYHALKIGDDEFLSAKAEYNEAGKRFELAYAKEERQA